MKSPVSVSKPLRRTIVLSVTSPLMGQTLQDKHLLLRKQAVEVLKAIAGREFGYDQTGLPYDNKVRELL